MHKRNFLAALAAAAVAALPAAGLAQADYPAKPIKLIVPFPSGGTSDVMGRLMAEELGKALKQPVVVEDLGGAGGGIGMERAAKAAPDGYTLVLSGVVAVAALQTPSVRQKLESQGFVVAASGSGAYADFVAREIDRWGSVIRATGIKPE